MLSISVKEILFWKKTQLSKGGDHESLALLLDSVGGISTSDLNSLSINPEGNLYLKKKLRIFRKYLERTFTKFFSNSISLWNNFLERLKIKSYRKSSYS